MVQPPLTSRETFSSTVPEALAALVAPRYEPLRLLADHAGRKTLLARDCSADSALEGGEQLVIIKILLFHPDLDWQDLKLFEREVALLQAQAHPAIPRYLDSFELETPRNKGFALVQQYIEARSLQDHLAAGRTFVPHELEQLAQQLLDILDDLHNQTPRIIHRDIKPSNILLSDERSAHSVGRVYLIDFGSVQAVAPTSADGLPNNTMTIVGTYGYMPPEQFGGQALPASDLYSLGATLIYLASGRQPNTLVKDGLTLDFASHVGLDEGWVAWLSRLVEPSLEKRFCSVREARTALANRAGLVASSQPDGRLARSRRSRRGLWQRMQFEATVGGFVLTLPRPLLKLQLDEAIRPTPAQVNNGWIIGLGSMGSVIFTVGAIALFVLALLTVLTAGMILVLVMMLGIFLFLSLIILCYGGGFLLVGFLLPKQLLNRLHYKLGRSTVRVERDRIILTGRYEAEFKRSHLWCLRRSAKNKLLLGVQNQNLVITATPAELDWLTSLLEKSLGMEVEL